MLAIKEALIRLKFPAVIPACLPQADLMSRIGIELGHWVDSLRINLYILIRDQMFVPVSELLT